MCACGTLSRVILCGHYRCPPPPHTHTYIHAAKCALIKNSLVTTSSTISTNSRTAVLPRCLLKPYFIQVCVYISLLVASMRALLPSTTCVHTTTHTHSSGGAAGAERSPPLLELLRHFRSTQKNVLLHCHSGQNRCALAVAPPNSRLSKMALPHMFTRPGLWPYLWPMSSTQGVYHPFWRRMNWHTPVVGDRR
jgi:hypothetical protein